MLRMLKMTHRVFWNSLKSKHLKLDQPVGENDERHVSISMF